jgi:hypothetical protein
MPARKKARKTGTARKRTSSRAALGDDSETFEDACCASADEFNAPETSADPTVDVESSTRTVTVNNAPNDEAVRVEVRPGEIVITIKTAALQMAAPAALTTSMAHGTAGDEPQADSTRVGLTEVAADKLGQGYKNAWIRADLRDDYLSAMQKVKALGGILTSSGAIRALTAGVTAGRSRTSFHYTGRAIDLWIGTGMQGANDRYLIQRAGGTDKYPEWEVLCTSVNPLRDDPHFDASLIKTGDVDYLVWSKGPGAVTKRRNTTYFSLSAIMRQFGWVNIPARSDWKTEYLAVEWWHFQHHKGLVDGVSRFGDELRAIWPDDKVNKSGLALSAVFSGRSFRA